MSLPKAAFTIGIIESTCLLLVAIESISYELSDGYMFYTEYFQGQGQVLMIGGCLFAMVSLVIVFLMILGLYRNQSR